MELTKSDLRLLIPLAELPGLDPTDDTRLPDGSRLVDALALAAVLRQTGGSQ